MSNYNFDFDPVLENYINHMLKANYDKGHKDGYNKAYKDFEVIREKDLRNLRRFRKQIKCLKGSQ